ncbi:hypothetical protein E2C01_031546 [Portunus trituberculatus]|uniref:Uncharacterized protein n=1 Tax=Portunus trituberculatus TaxID=210409 RepID=A0A5B7EX52_PORTR|nr:hypothetical protein [Portunus trituberculatus]
MYSTRTDCVKPRFRMVRLRKRVRNVLLHARHYLFCYVLRTQRWVSDTETVIIPGKISIYNTSSGPPSLLRQNARGTSALGDPEEGLEK